MRLAGKLAQHVALDAVLHAARFALRGDHVIPAPRGRGGGQAEHAVGQRVAQVVVEEQPAVEILGADFSLNPL